MEQKIIEQTYTGLLYHLYHAMCIRATEPITIQGMMFDCVEDGSGINEMENRVKLTNKNLKEFLKIHESAIDAFGHIENAINSGNFKKIKEPGERLIHSLESYDSLIEKHLKKPRINHYLSWPLIISPVPQGFQQLLFRNTMFSLENLSRREMKDIFIPGNSLYGEDNGKKYQGRPQPDHNDDSYKGKLELIKYYLREIFRM